MSVDAALARANWRRRPDAGGRALQVLVVEDDDADAYLLDRALCDHVMTGRIFHAVDGVHALDLIERGATPDLAFIDLHMPRKDGLTLLADLRRLNQEFHLVVLTSSSAPADIVRSRLRGADCVLAKPDSAEELRKIVSTVIAAVCTEQMTCSR